MAIQLRRRVGELIRNARRAGRRWELTWRYGLNLTSTLSYRTTAERYSGETARVLAELNRNGIAISSVGALLGCTSDYPTLLDAVRELMRANVERIEEARRALHASGSGALGKTYVFNLLGDRPVLDPESVYGRIALAGPVRQIAEGYYKMHCRLREYNVWLNLANQNEASQSQLWHRDPEDRYILKMFLFLADVDEGAGPFTYACGTHQKGSFRTQPAFLYKDGGTPRSSDEQMAAVVPRDQWVTALGPAGTIVFADTRGFHKGGLARHRDRVVFVTLFCSPGAARGGISTAKPLC
jgi:hypothetical protein